jgi:methylated-DNA-[protein]-cysteine S-methyltransferase
MWLNSYLADYYKYVMAFRDSVYKAVSRIPKGMVSTYKSVAASAGSKGAYRAVGTALKENPHAPTVPCHRVVKSDGSLGGYARGAVEKKRILLREGVLVNNGKIKDFKKVFFNLISR